MYAGSGRKIPFKEMCKTSFTFPDVDLCSKYELFIVMFIFIFIIYLFIDHTRNMHVIYSEGTAQRQFAHQCVSVIRTKYVTQCVAVLTVVTMFI